MEGLKAGVDANNSSRSLREVKVETEDDIIDVSLDKNAAMLGTHQIEVLHCKVLNDKWV